MRKIIYIILGTISLTLGTLGIVLPVLPTTPFLLLTAFFYVRSSTKLYNKLMQSKHFGPYIKSFMQDKSLPLRIKIISITMLWLTIGCSAIFFIEKWWIRIILLVVAIGVTWHILSYKTRR